MRAFLLSFALGLLTLGWTAATPATASAAGHARPGYYAKSIPTRWGWGRSHYRWGRGFYPGYGWYGGYRGYYPYYGGYYGAYYTPYRSFYYPYAYGSYYPYSYGYRSFYSPYSYYGSYYSPGFSFWIW